MQIAAMASSVVIGALALSTGPDAVQLAAQATTVQLVLPIDVVELVKVTFTGIAAVGGAVAAIFSVWGKVKAGNAEKIAIATDTKIEVVSHQINGLLADRDKGNLAKGEAKGIAAGEKTAETLAKGQAQGAEAVLAAAAAVNPAPSSAILGPGEAPIPVADEASERVADATEQLARAAEKTAEKS